MPVFMMITGLPGSGKSTWIKEYVGACLENYDLKIKVFSSDKIREELYGDEAIQGNPSDVFDIMKTRTLQALKEGYNVIYDATNITRKNRRSILSQIPKDIEKICCIVWARIETCVSRDARRIRSVGESVILKMVKRFETPWYDEGFDKIQFINTDTSLYDYEVDIVPKLNIPHDNPHHPGLISEHISRVEEEARKLEDDNDCDLNTAILSYMAKYHDVGKIYTKTFINSKGEKTDVAHYYDHQNVSAYITLGLIHDSDANILISWLVNLHMEPFFNESKYYRNVEEKFKRYIEKFHELDVKGA